MIGYHFKRHRTFEIVMKCFDCENYYKKLEFGGAMIFLSFGLKTAGVRYRVRLIVSLLNKNSAYTDSGHICVDLTWFGRVEGRQNQGAG